jgi:hypothetical protein
MRVRIGGLHGRELLATIWKVTAASLLMGAACFASTHLLSGWLGVSRWARMADLAISIPLGAGVFYFAARALGVAELEMAETAIAGPLTRRLKNWRAKMN